LAREEGLTLNSVVLGAWALLLAHWSGDRDVTLGAAFSGRPSEEPGIESMVGPCVANLPVRMLVPAEASLGTWMTDLQGAQSEVAQHQYAPLERIQDWAGVPWRMRLFDSLLVFQNYSVDEGARRLGPEVDVEILSLPEATNYPITLTVLPGAELRLRLLYHRSHSSPATARLMMTDLVSLLGAMSRGGAVSLGSLLEQLPARSRSWAASPIAPRRAAFAAPRSETENRIAAIWAELFQVPQVGLDDNFFDLGGHSVLLIRAHALLGDALGLALPIVALLQYPTVRSLAQFLGGGQRGAARESDTADRARLAREAFARRRNLQGKH
jgi:non-ribosomal peptide synthetase component F